MRGTWQTTEGGGDLGAAVGVIAIVLVIAAVAGPIVAAVAALVHLLFVVVIAAVALAVLAGIAAGALWLRHRRASPAARVSFLGAVQPRPSRALPAPQPPAIGAPKQELHLHFHGVDAEDVSAILGRVNRDHGQGV